MVKTGLILDVLNIIAMLAALSPALIILFRKIWQTDLLNFLMVFSLLTFMHQLFSGVMPVNQGSYPFTQAVFSLAEFILLLYMLKPASKQKWARDLFYILSIAFLSVIITVYAIRGAAASAGIVLALQHLILLAVAVLGMIQLLRSGQVFIFQLPLFWIILGVIAFSCMQLLLAMIPSAGAQPQFEMAIMQCLVVVIRSIFFIIAASAKIKNPATKEAARFEKF
ncbi:hypothetical protein HHL16_17415 [Pseudoflavitalea sp. G-6-1-2]|uniref:hypothetical protein n=1 Tax=Pseudoflavitalea sp. G-6-1-2 TaxID=2728841 RepID=UPI00146A1C04|nr:hypothetical protein [Pseudoflavitalea sp. G-6-1-2]NML22666.1 hypothetical protein [Pseudoflavitalea sp. G-6-1-2]